MNLIVVSFFKPFICPFLTTCAFQLYRLMPTPLLSELAHLSSGQLRRSWDPFGDHGMKLVAFKVKLIHAPALCQNILYTYEPLSFSNVSAGVIFKGVSLQGPEQIR